MGLFWSTTSTNCSEDSNLRHTLEMRTLSPLNNDGNLGLPCVPVHALLHRKRDQSSGHWWRRGQVGGTLSPPRVDAVTTLTSGWRQYKRQRAIRSFLQLRCLRAELKSEAGPFHAALSHTRTSKPQCKECLRYTVEKSFPLWESQPHLAANLSLPKHSHHSLHVHSTSHFFHTTSFNNSSHKYSTSSLLLHS